MKVSIVAWVRVCAFSVLPAFAMANEDQVALRVASVTWPTNYTGAAAPLPDPRLAQVGKVYLPVLIPRSFLVEKDLQLVAQPTSYTFSSSSNGAVLVFSGTRIVTDLPGKLPISAEQPEVATQVTLAEKSALATTVRAGAAYLASVECRSEADTRCADARFVTSLVDTAVFLGGAKGEPLAQSGASAPLPPAKPFDPNFTYRPAGELVSGSGQGVASPVNHAPGMRFPIESPPAYLNSQVWGVGGSHGPKGSWKNAANHTYPWRDTFCESRSRATPICPAGKGHQGVDIRPEDWTPEKYWVVAAEDGVISDIGTYTVTLQAKGTRYRYLHMKMSKLAVKVGQAVNRGDHLGYVSNDFDDTSTTMHLHFEMLQNLSGKGWVHVPPYQSLVIAYKKGN
ncbi:M23 family metallopeptidase [Pseudomonas brassicacearum]|uniref:M23 family metallopeptidase n=1 Tax=Pseudomonas brassicacearum TaxID=930166 RepID=UPI002733ECF7|nr:M23 family metallopeptidase [Pseudomonas brassicacearum]WLG66268.1 M23 family metallopeptidase [Pseudomonas brassicacearum]